MGQFDKTVTCSDFDLLLSDALDGVLGPEAQSRFERHAQACATCGSLFRETSAGMNWLHALEEVEAPANLVHNILAVTVAPAQGQVAVVKLAWRERLLGFASDVLVPVRMLVAQPRIAMTGAMAVFSIMLSLDLAGVKLADFRHADLRPSALKEQATMKYYETSQRVVKYYENIRLVYEVESRLQELKRSSEEPEQRPPDRNKTQNKNEHEHKQNYYSKQQSEALLAQGSNQKLQQSNLGFFQHSDAKCDACAKMSSTAVMYEARLAVSGSGLESTRSVFA